MSRLPHRQDLPTQAATIIKEMIVGGEFHALLPGERTLADKLQIGRDTLRLSLEILESEGWITPRQHGKRRGISKPGLRVDQRKKSNRIAFLSPKSLREFPPWLLIEFDLVRGLLNRRGYELELVSPGLFHLRNPARKLEKLVEDVEVDAWILYQCPAPVQLWFEEQRLPALIRGYPQPEVIIPCLDEDWHAAAFHAGGLLKRHGHHRIGLLMPDVKLGGLEATEQGLAKAIESGPNPGSVYKMIDRGEPDSVLRVLEVAFGLENPPTAIIATRSRYVLNLMSWMAERRLRIPDDLSLVALCYETWYEQLRPTITHYHSEPDTIAGSVVRKILRIASTELKSTQQKLLIPECFEGASVRKSSC